MALPAGTQLPGDSVASTLIRNPQSFLSIRLAEALVNPAHPVGVAAANLGGGASGPEAVSSNTNSGAAATLVGNGINTVTLTGNPVLTFPSLPAAGYTKTFMVALYQDATGGRTVTWPANIKWPGGVPPILTTAAGKHDLLSFSCYDGATWTGLVAAQGI